MIFKFLLTLTTVRHCIWVFRKATFANTHSSRSVISVTPCPDFLGRRPYLILRELHQICKVSLVFPISIALSSQSLSILCLSLYLLSQDRISAEHIMYASERILHMLVVLYWLLNSWCFTKQYDIAYFDPSY